MLTAKYDALMLHYLAGKLYWKYGDELYLLLEIQPKEYITLLEDSFWLRGNLKYIPYDTPWEIRKKIICLDDIIDIEFSFNRTMLLYLQNGYLLAISPSGQKVACICVYPEWYFRKKNAGSLFRCLTYLKIEIYLRFILLRWYFYD